MIKQKAALLIIGDEILSGKVQDVNLQTLALKLGKKGYQLGEVRVVADDEQDIVNAINQLKNSYFLVFTSGGIGPTHDDITTASIAKALGLELEVNETARCQLAQHSEQPGLSVNAARLKMATLPKGADLILSKLTKAPGIRIENICILAGIPEIFNDMLDEILNSLPPGRPIHTLFLETTHVGEGTIATELGEIQQAFVGVVLIGSYPQMEDGRFARLQITFRSTDFQQAQDCRDQVAALIAKYSQ